MNVPTGQYCPPSIGMVAAFKLESLAGIVGIRTDTGPGTVANKDGLCRTVSANPTGDTEQV